MSKKERWGIHEGIKTDIENGADRNDVALTYSLAMQSPWNLTNWDAINQTIIGKWGPQGLNKIKAMAAALLAFEGSP